MEFDFCPFFIVSSHCATCRTGFPRSCCTPMPRGVVRGLEGCCGFALFPSLFLDHSLWRRMHELHELQRVGCRRANPLTFSLSLARTQHPRSLTPISLSLSLYHTFSRTRIFSEPMRKRGETCLGREAPLNCLLVRPVDTRSLPQVYTRNLPQKMSIAATLLHWSSFIIW